jgi:hypothetical protein
MSALAGPAASDRPSYFGQAVLIGFRLLGWTAVTLLVVGGIFVVAFAVLGNFTLQGFFLQLANLADRYGTADAVRRAAFHDDLRLVAAVALSATMVFRRGSLGRVFIIDKET